MIVDPERADYLARKYLALATSVADRVRRQARVRHGVDRDDMTSVANLAIAETLAIIGDRDERQFRMLLCRVARCRAVDHVRHAITIYRAEKQASKRSDVPSETWKIDFWLDVDGCAKLVTAKKWVAFCAVFGPDLDDSYSVDDAARKIGRKRSTIHEHVIPTLCHIGPRIAGEDMIMASSGDRPIKPSIPRSRLEPKRNRVVDRPRSRVVNGRQDPPSRPSPEPPKEEKT